MKSRHRAREVALQILYRYDVNLANSGTPVPTGTALINDLQFHFNHFQVADTLRQFAAELVAGTLSKTQELDALLEKHAVNWKVSRMSLIDRNLLRMSAYELLNFPDIPPSVTIDEAVELAKQFGTAETPAFVNGILDSVKQEKAAQSTPAPAGSN